AIHRCLDSDMTTWDGEIATGRSGDPHTVRAHAITFTPMGYTTLMEMGLLEKTPQNPGWFRLHMPLRRESLGADGTLLFSIEAQWQSA
ncbi:unnamed protein product, partial [Symbiodinium sp. CCMP2592]